MPPKLERRGSEADWHDHDHPVCERKACSPTGFLCNVTASAVLQGCVVIGLAAAVLTTIEKRFGLSSTEAGVIIAMYDVGAIAAVVPLSYASGLGHMPRWLGAALLGFGLGTAMFALPHFLTDKYDGGAGGAGTQVCDGTEWMELGCGSTEEEGMLPVFAIAQIVQGACGALLYTAGPTFMERNVPRSVFALHMGVFFAGTAIGPATGFIVGGAALNAYVEVGDETDLEPGDENWVGAWWVPFLFVATLCVLCAATLTRFPPHFKRERRLSFEGEEDVAAAATMREAPPSPTAAAGAAGAAPAADPSLEGLTDMLRSLARNPAYVFTVLAVSAEAHLVSAYAAFLPKIVQTQFGVTAAVASLSTGAVVVPGAAGGMFFGGWLIKKMRWGHRRVARYCFLVGFLALGMTLTLTVGCDPRPVVGVNTLVDAGFGCSGADCACSTIDYTPVCVDGLTYVNPCFAGCTGEAGDDAYGNCSATASAGTCDALPSDLLAEDGACELDCDKMGPFLICLLLVMFFTFANNAPATVHQMSCVKPDERATALAVNSAAFRLLGNIPGPIVLGAIIDSTCEFTEDDCGADGSSSCDIYDPEKMRWRPAMFAVGFKSLSIFFWYMSLRYLRTQSDPAGEKYKGTDVVASGDGDVEAAATPKDVDENETL